MNAAALIVAIGAFAASVAGVFFAKRAADASSRSAEEAMRTRLDTLGSQVFIAEPLPQRERWKEIPGHGGYPDPVVAQPGDSLSSPGHDDVRLLVGAVVQIRNEGSMTATVQVRAGRVDIGGWDDPLWIEVPPGEQRASTKQPDGLFYLTPGERERVLVRAGRTLKEWRAVGDQPVVVEIAAWTSHHESKQQWTLTLQGQLLTGVPENASLFRVVGHVSPKATVEQLPRVYPPAATSVARRWSS